MSAQSGSLTHWANLCIIVIPLESRPIKLARRLLFIYTAVKSLPQMDHKSSAAHIRSVAPNEIFMKALASAPINNQRPAINLADKSLCELQVHYMESRRVRSCCFVFVSAHRPLGDALCLRQNHLRGTCAWLIRQFRRLFMRCYRVRALSNSSLCAFENRT